MIPYVSVVVPTRDRLEKLRSALAAVEKQHFQDFEIIVVDDGSVDATTSWLHSQCSHIRVITLEKAGGAAQARNRGIDLARGKLIAFLDDDDIWHPAYLEAQVAHLSAYPTATLSYTDHVEMNVHRHASRPNTQPLLSYPTPLIRLLTESFIHTMSVVVCRSEAFLHFGRFNESLDIVHDLDWYRRILAGGGSFVYLARSLVERSVPGGLVKSHRKWFQEERTAHAQAFAENPVDKQIERMIRAYRSLFFVRASLAQRDWNFALARLVTAFAVSPYWTIRIAVLRFVRQLQFHRRVTQ